MRNKFFQLVVTVSLIPVFSGCITKKIVPRLSEFSSSVSITKDSISELYGKFRDLEIETRAEESRRLSSVSPDDFEPRVFTRKVLNDRMDLANLLYLYSLGIKSVFEGNENLLAEQLSGVEKGLEAIQLKFPNLLPKKREKTLFAVLTAVPRAFSAAKKRRFMIRTMREMQRVITKLTERLIREIGSSLILSENYFKKIFRERIEKEWPSKTEKRVKYATLAKRLVRKKYELRQMCLLLTRALKILPAAHDAILDAVILKKDALEGIREFVGEAAMIRASFKKFDGSE